MRLTLKLSTGCLVLFFVLCAAGVWSAPLTNNFVLVVNVNNDVSAITLKETELIFLTKKRSWPNGRKIAVVINENPILYDSFSHTVLRRSPRQFLNFRKKMLFRGQGMPPPTVKTDEEVIEFVTTHEGGLGYINANAVIPTVKVIPISQ